MAAVASTASRSSSPRGIRWPLSGSSASAFASGPLPPASSPGACRRTRIGPCHAEEDLVLRQGQHEASRGLAGSHQPVRRRLPCEERVEVVEALEAHGVARLDGGAAEMGQEEGVLEAAIAGVELRLVFEDVEAGGGEL